MLTSLKKKYLNKLWSDDPVHAYDETSSNPMNLLAENSYVTFSEKMV